MKALLLVVDANACSQAFGNHEQFLPVRNALFLGRPRRWALAHGGKLTEELCAVAEAQRALITLDRAGRLVPVSRDEADREAQHLVDTGLCRSDDYHVLAVARLTMSRLLCSHDTALIIDFTNKDLIANPRGKVYQNAKHRNLLNGRW